MTLYKGWSRPLHVCLGLLGLAACGSLDPGPDLYVLDLRGRAVNGLGWRSGLNGHTPLIQGPCLFAGPVNAVCGPPVVSADASGKAADRRLVARAEQPAQSTPPAAAAARGISADEAAAADPLGEKQKLAAYFVPSRAELFARAALPQGSFYGVGLSPQPPDSAQPAPPTVLQTYGWRLEEQPSAARPGAEDPLAEQDAAAPLDFWWSAAHPSPVAAPDLETIGRYYELPQIEELAALEAHDALLVPGLVELAGQVGRQLGDAGVLAELAGEELGLVVSLYEPGSLDGQSVLLKVELERAAQEELASELAHSLSTAAQLELEAAAAADEAEPAQAADAPAAQAGGAASSGGQYPAPRERSPRTPEAAEPARSSAQG
ncbi:hypothetical protein IT575_14640 [bacterium]|nr:hypothetical protein [bacterium]